MPIITINGTPVNLSNTGGAPVWSDGIIELFQLTEEVLNSLVGAGDVTKQQFILDSSHNPAVNVTLTGLSFSTAVVRAAFIRYSVFRETSSNTAYEVGEMMIVYNADNSVGQKWEVQRDYVSDSGITFTIDDAGQFSFSLSTLAGTGHNGKICFVAQALTQ